MIRNRIFPMVALAILAVGVALVSMRVATVHATPRVAIVRATVPAEKHGADALARLLANIRAGMPTGTYAGRNVGITVGDCGYEFVGDPGAFCDVP